LNPSGNSLRHDNLDAVEEWLNIPAGRFNLAGMSVSTKCKSMDEKIAAYSSGKTVINCHKFSKVLSKSIIIGVAVR